MPYATRVPGDPTLWKSGIKSCLKDDQYLLNFVIFYRPIAAPCPGNRTAHCTRVSYIVKYVE